METNPKIIGRTERANFPELALRGIRVKTDTGAFTSSIHCCRIEETDDQELRVVFLDADHPKFTDSAIIFKDYSKKLVKSSNGVSEDRFVVSTTIRFHHNTYTIALSLTDRGDMRYPVLIGRKFLTENHFIVNPRLRNALRETKKPD